MQFRQFSVMRFIGMVRFTSVAFFTTLQLFTAALALAGQSYDLVISGAGPAGLATALVASKNGAKVLIVEKRPFEKWGTRMRAVLIDADAHDTLVQYGATQLPFLPTQAFRGYFGTTGESRVEIPNTETFRDITKLLVGRRINGTIPIMGLEHALYEELRSRPNVEFLFDSEIESRTGHDLLIHGNPIHASLLVVSEGAHGRFLAANQLKRVKAEVPESHWIVRNFALDGATSGIHRVKYGPYGIGFHGLAFFDSSYVTVYATPYDGQVTSESQLEIDRVATEMAHELGIHGAPLEPAARFDVQVDHAETFVPEPGVLIIGDAAHKVDPATAFGVSVSIADALRVQRFIENGSVQEFNREMGKAVRSSETQARTIHNLWYKFAKSKLAQPALHLILPLVKHCARLLLKK